MNRHWSMAAENALGCHMAHVILASKGKALKVLCLQNRGTHLPPIRLDQTMLFSIHPLIPTSFPKSFDLPSQDVTKLKRDQALAKVFTCRSCKCFWPQAVPKAQMQTLALSREQVLNCKKDFLKINTKLAFPYCLQKKIHC